MTVGSKSTIIARGTYFPEPVSLKNVLNESSYLCPSFVVLAGMEPSAWIPCSKQNNSQQALPIWTPAWPMWIEIHSRMITCFFLVPFFFFFLLSNASFLSFQAYLLYNIKTEEKKNYISKVTHQIIKKRSFSRRVRKKVIFCLWGKEWLNEFLFWMFDATCLIHVIWQLIYCESSWRIYADILIESQIKTWTMLRTLSFYHRFNLSLSFVPVSVSVLFI